MQSPSDVDSVLDRVGDGPNRRIDRRRVPRYETCGSAVADFGEGPDGHVVAGVELIDSSASGLGFISPTPVPVGRPVRIYIGHSPVPDRSGRVARCIEIKGPDGRIRGWRVGLDTGYARAA